MSYRSFKHLLGETSLERKCRFIFGGGILVLVTFSFYWYGQKTESLVISQTSQAARMFVNPSIMNLHYKAFGNDEFASVIDVLWGDLTPLDDLPSYESRILNPYPVKDSKKVLARGKVEEPELDDMERAALARFLQAASSEEAYRKAGTPRPRPYTFADGTPMWQSRIVNQKKEYQYVQAVLFKPGCLMAPFGLTDEQFDRLTDYLSSLD